MTATASDQVSPTPAPPRRRRRLAAAALLLVGLALLGGLSWAGWRRYTAPEPPEVPLDGAEPAVAQAVQAAREKVREAPYSAESWGHLGKVLRACGYVSQATGCFAQAEQLAPAEPRWPYLRGEGLTLLGDVREAIPHLRRAVELCAGHGPDEFASRLRLAEALLAAGEHGEAETHLRRALELEPDHPSAHLGLGLLAYARNDLERSRQHLLRCQHSVFTRQKACARLAEICQRLGDDEAAARFARQAAALGPDHSWGDSWVLDCLRLAVGKSDRFRYAGHLEAQGRLAEAVAVLRELAEGGDAKALTGLGKNLTLLGDFAGAEEALRSALRAAPESVQAHYHLARCLWARAERLWERGEREQALELYRTAAESARRALARKPDHALAHLLLGLCLERLGRPREALAALRLAAECGPELPDPSLHLGEALAREGKAEEARRHLQNALRLAPPDDPRPRAALDRLPAAGKKGS